MTVKAETTLPTEVEKIDVKLAEHQAAVTFLAFLQVRRRLSKALMEKIY